MSAVFHKVWFRPEANRWPNFDLFSMRDVGTLLVNEESLEFNGAKGSVFISGITNISFGRQGMDFVNNWVRVDYQDGKTAFFADGRLLGWSGVLGGTKNILRAVWHLHPSGRSSE